MASSDSGEPMQTVTFQSGDLDDLVTLADLAGIKGPGNTIKILMELVTLGVPPKEVHQLLRDVLASKSRTRRTDRATSRHTSKRSNTSAESVQENTVPQS